MELDHALRRNQDLFSQEVRQRILSPPSINAKLNELFLYAGDHGIPLYVLIDEYDNFANTVLAHRGAEAYQSFTHGGGFYRNFFAALKAGAGRSGGGLERLFITNMQFGYVLELKYLKRSETLDQSLLAEKLREAVLQVRGYLADSSLRCRHPSVRHIGLAVVFHGWEMVAYEAVDDDATRN